MAFRASIPVRELGGVGKCERTGKEEGDWFALGEAEKLSKLKRRPPWKEGE